MDRILEYSTEFKWNYWTSITKLLLVVLAWYQHTKNPIVIDSLQIKWDSGWKYVLDSMQQACTSELVHWCSQLHSQ